MAMRQAGGGRGEKPAINLDKRKLLNIFHLIVAERERERETGEEGKKATRMGRGGGPCLQIN
jgi:hypothetical protein